MNKNLISILAVFIALTFPVYKLEASEENFNPNMIISDFDMLDYDSMSLAEIQEFLENQGGYLAKYKCQSAYGGAKSAAEIIYDAAVNNYDCDNADLSENADEAERNRKCKKTTTVNPKVLLVLLQKEQSLITHTNPEQSRLDWAMGYGCPDGGGCNEYWRGFGKQVNSAALQFKDYMENPGFYSYRKGGTYTFSNPYSTIKKETNLVVPVNQATAALYNYTPHVYNGNYNFFKFWNQYFTRGTYPDGTLLQARGEPGVWLIQNGEKRPFLSKSALTSRFDEKKIVMVSQSDLTSYPKGTSIRFPNYSLIMSPSGDIYLLVDNKKRRIVSPEAMRQVGFNPEEVMQAGWEDVNAYQDGKPITADSVYPTGALLQNKKTGGVYWVFEGEKAPIWDKIFLETKFKNKSIIPVEPEKLEQYETIDPVKFDNGELVKSSISPAVYLIDSGAKRPFLSGKVFEDLGYKWENIITVGPKALYLYDNGEIIKE